MRERIYTCDNMSVQIPYTTRIRKIGNSFYVNVPREIMVRMKLRKDELVIVKIMKVGEEI